MSLIEQITNVAIAIVKNSTTDPSDQRRVTQKSSLQHFQQKRYRERNILHPMCTCACVYVKCKKKQSSSATDATSEMINNETNDVRIRAYYVRLEIPSSLANNASTTSNDMLLSLASSEPTSCNIVPEDPTSRAPSDMNI
jgi:hypothetical protein